MCAPPEVIKLEDSHPTEKEVADALINDIFVDTLEELSSIYIDAILKIQPDGDYYLAGSSLGGTIAYEMACQLTAMGKKVVFVNKTKINKINKV